MRLSVALIARDEETMLPGCLESIKNADEIVVVDTGSTDGTVEIARQYTDEVFEIEWRDNFAAARNYAKALCTGDWIYSIDADHINETPVPEIKSEIERIAGHSVASVLINNHHKAAWLWHNDPGIEWQGRVHEVLNQPATIDTAVAQSIRPRGYSNTKRNIRLLQKENDSPRTRFYLGREYFDLGDYDKAADWLQHYLKAPAFPAEEAEAWLTLAKCQWYLQQGTEARASCLQAIGVNPDFTEALELMAEMTYEPWKSKWAFIASNSTNRDVLFNRSAHR